MKLYVKCARCRGDLEVDLETVSNAKALGQELVLEHDVCPGMEPRVEEKPTVRRFRVQFVVVELPPPGDEQYEALGLDEEKVLKEGAGFQHKDPTFGGAALDPLLGLGKTVEARNLAEAINGPATTWLNETWPKVQENAAWADVPTPPAPTTAT